MTKTRLGQSDAKPTEGNPLPLYTALHVTDCEPSVRQAPLPGTACWYVLGILSTIFCCLPCGVIGMVHAMIAKHEGERGNMAAHQKRMTQAKCWTLWSIVLGLLTILAMSLYTIGTTIGFSRAYYYICGNGPDMYFYNQWNDSNVQWNDTSIYGDSDLALEWFN